MAGEYDALRLDRQLCFPLYAASREVTKRYMPYLKPLDLTYTQYIAMMVLWETGQILSRELGERLYLDSGTLSPVLKKLEEKGYITRRRPSDDERNLLVALTDEGEALKERALNIPRQLGSCIPLAPEEARELYRLLYKIVNSGQ